MQDQTLSYFEALYGLKPEDAVLCVWRLDGHRSHWFRDPRTAAEYAIAHREEDIYAQIGVGAQSLGVSNRLKAEQVTGIPALWVDFDIEGEAHQKKNLPRTVTEALAILPEGLPPSMIVSSGHGAHAYWLLKEFLLFEVPFDRERAARVLQQWERLIRLRAQTHGWTIDATHDMARVLRIPGTKNNKERDRGLIVDCTLIGLNEHRYNLSEFEEYLEGVPGMNTPPEIAARTIATATPRVDSLNLAPDRVFEKLDFLLQDAKFNAIWHHARQDMADQSQSAYDLAICNTLFKAGLSDQEIVDAMIHNRRLNGTKTKLRPDYYQRTLAKARVRLTGGYDAADVENGAVSRIPDKPEPTLEEKSVICESLSALLNLMHDGEPNILRVVKLTGTKPVWRIDLKTRHSITITGPNGILVKERMKAAIFAACNRIMPPYKPSGWESVIRAFLAATVEIPAGVESTATGEAHRLLEHYLQTVGIRESCADAFSDPRYTYAPFVADGRIAIDVPDFREWIIRRVNEKLEISDLINRLSAIGSIMVEFHIANGRQKQCRWLLPPCFDPETWRDLAAKAGLLQRPAMVQ